MSSLFKKEFKAQDIKSGLYIVSTPIGNLEDITIRAINILKKSNYILCEDTRVSSTLLRKYNINSNLISNHKFNEKNNLERFINYLKKDLIVSMISDAGTPVISDPGQLLIKECIKNKIKIFPIPGPSAVTSAMSISGFNDKYLFFGFLPNSEKQIEKELEKLRQFPYTIIFFISPQKINKVLKYFKRFFQNRNILIAREMTKIYEEYIREKIETLKLFDNKPKGELTVVVSNIFESKKKLKVLSQSIKKEIINMLKKYSSKDVASFMSRKEDISKKIVYDYCLKQKK